MEYLKKENELTDGQKQFLLSQGTGELDYAHCVYVLYGDNIKRVIESDTLLVFNGKYFIDSKIVLQRVIKNVVQLRNSILANKIKELEQLPLNEINAVKNELQLYQRLNKDTNAKMKVKKYDSIIDELRLFTQIEINQEEFFDIKYETLLNVKNGVIDLTSKTLMPHSNKYLFTYCINIEYNSNKICKLFETQLSETIKYYKDSDEAKEYIQKLFGYAITGKNIEKKAVILHGDGDTGKSLLVNILRDVYGANLCGTLSFNAISRDRSRNADQNFDLYKCRDKKLMSIMEPPENARIYEPTLKSLIGTDIITAAKKGDDELDMKITFKLFIATNHNIVASSSDQPLWNRFLVIPLYAGYSQVDTHKYSKLSSKENLQGILTWLIDGAYNYLNSEEYKQGLYMYIPQVYKDELQNMKNESDLVYQWLQDSDYKITGNENDFILFADAYQDFSSWCIANNYSPLYNKVFSKNLKEKGCDSKTKSVNNTKQKYLLGLQ